MPLDDVAQIRNSGYPPKQVIRMSNRAEQRMRKLKRKARRTTRKYRS